MNGFSVPKIFHAILFSMFWNRYFWPSSLVLIVVVTLHWAASLSDWYETIWWYDIVMHFLGGLWVFLFALWIIRTQYGIKLEKHCSFRNLLLFVLLVGISWEIYELIFGFDDLFREGYFLDMPLDLVMDMSGAVSGGFLFYLRD